MCECFCRVLVVNDLTRHAVSLHANGVPFDLRKIYVSGGERYMFRVVKVKVSGCKRRSLGRRKIYLSHLRGGKWGVEGK